MATRATISVTDEDLMARIAVGEQSAIDELFARYERPLLAYAQRRLDDRMDAEELVQETILRLWRMAGRFDRAKGSVDCLVFTMASRVLADVFRRRGRRVSTTELAGVDEASGGLDGTDRTELALVVGAGMATLSADHRAVIELAYWGGLSQSEIAAHLDIPLGTVKTRTYYALRSLQAALA
jgi:RNA polymerase sigma-70 factor, ECF subfamily